MATPLDRLKITLADRYTLERELGAGGMATVYLAHDLRHNRKVAIKVLRPEVAEIIGAERFLKEIETTANLQHPNILPLFDSGRVEGTVFYVMPYLAGESLRARLAREVQLPVADAIRIAVEVAAGLDYAHRHGVIHRDIKPDNVLFHDGRALVADRYQHPRLSPDGTRIAVDVRSANSLGDVWVFQLGRPSGTRLTSEGGRDWAPEWTPDGQELIYISERPYFDLYRRAADASRQAEPLLTGGHDHYTGTATRYFANGFNLSHPTLSPDGRWMAYDSDESGRVEVYVQSFPEPGVKRWKVSPASGSEPLWTRGGRELVYRKGDSVIAASMDLPNSRSGQPVALFGGPYPDSPGWTRPRSYDVSGDGERFLLLKLPPERERPRVNVVVNWFEELRAKVPR